MSNKPSRVDPSMPSPRLAPLSAAAPALLAAFGRGPLRVPAAFGSRPSGVPAAFGSGPPVVSAISGTGSPAVPASFGRGGTRLGAGPGDLEIHLLLERIHTADLHGEIVTQLDDATRAAADEAVLDGIQHEEVVLHRGEMHQAA